MKRLWFITNPHSGSSDVGKAEAIESAFAERGLSFVGRTDFPEHDLPTPEDLEGASADTVVLFAGDGTINAAVCALADWDGAILILPGGTMNMLAKMLHGDADPPTILAAAHDRGRRVILCRGRTVSRAGRADRRPRGELVSRPRACSRSEPGQAVPGDPRGVAAHVRPRHPPDRRPGFSAARPGRLHQDGGRSPRGRGGRCARRTVDRRSRLELGQR